MIDCPRCGSVYVVKSGIVKDRQRYKCNDCIYYYTVSNKLGSGNKLQKRQALELYLEGLGFRSIGRILNFSHITIYNWIRQYGKDLDLINT